MTADGAAVLAELRRTRRRQRVAQIHWIDAFYQVYVTAIAVIAVVVIASGFVGDGRVRGTTLDDVVARGPAVAGLAAAVALAVGLRSGGRGGPLALEAADVRHVLLSPVDRAAALRGPALRQLRFLAFAGAAAGAVAGQLALRRLPGNPVTWLLWGTAFGLVVVALGYGAALVASSRRLRTWPGTLLGGVLIAWSVAEAVGRAPTAPATLVGRLALWPLRFDALALLPVVVAVGLVAVGIGGLAGVSLEAAERRTSLVGQLKFAVTLQDLRTVLVLRRQLALELPRAQPWVRGSNRSPRFPVWRRGWRGVLRWPASRLARVVVLAVVTGLVLRGVWAGTTPLFILAGAATWLIALDAIEAMAQETDHPGLRDGYPVEVGELMVRHLPVTASVMLLASAVAAGVAAIPGAGALPVSVAAIAALAMALSATAGAAVSVLAGAPGSVDQLAIAAPEFAGMRTVMRTTWPPGLAMLGALPVVAARTALHHRPVVATPASLATVVALPILVVCALVGGWVRFREPIHVWFKHAMDLSAAAQAEKAASRKGAVGATPTDEGEDHGADQGDERHG